MIRVLIVDDDKLARRGLASLMHWETYGMAVVGEAQNGKNALQFIQEHPVDLVFVDIDMPEMNGIEFMEECRRIKPDVQFVVLSFFENFSYVQSTLRLGGLDYISKTSMELDNGDTILQRIVEKFEQCISKKVPLEEMGKELQETWKECRTQYWFFNDVAFERLKKLMHGAEPKVSNVRRMEMMIVRHISELERILELPESTVPLFSDIEEMVGWLTLYREKIYKMVSGRSFGNDAEMILKAIFYMKEHLAENLSTSIVAQHVGCSRSYFCTNFKKFSGLSFGDFLQQIRIERAKELLRTTSDSVTEVAFSSGYNNIYYFNRVFQSAENCSPMEFRKNQAGTGKVNS